MNAVQPSRSPLRAVEPRRRPTVRNRPKQSHPHRAIATEVGVKLTVNVVLAIAALSALVKLVPYSLAQQSKLHEVRAEVALAEDRVAQLRTDFNRNFDAQQAKSVMQEQSNRINPQQRRLVWVNSASPEPALSHSSQSDLETSP